MGYSQVTCHKFWTDTIVFLQLDMVVLRHILVITHMPILKQDE